jgi:hypothetical protein
MTSTSRKVGAFAVFGCALMLMAAECPGPDHEARQRLDSLEQWADTMKYRADQNLQWAFVELDKIHNWICSKHPDPAVCPGGNSDPTQPPDSIPKLLH